MFVCMLLAAAVQPPSVSLDFTRVDETAYKRVDGLALERKAIARLLEEGFALAPKSAHADIEVKVENTGARLTIRSEGVESRSIELRGSVSELHLEFLQKLVAVARDAQHELPTASTPPAPVIKPPQADLVAPAPIEHQHHEPPKVEHDESAALVHFSLAAQAGALGRLGGFDANIALAALLHVRQWALELLASFTPSGAAQLHIQEPVAALMAWYRWPLGAWRVGVGLGGGLHLHLWQDTLSTDINRTGLALDPHGRAGLLAGFAFSSRMLLALVATATFQPLGRVHVRDGMTLWARGPLGAEVSLRLEILW